jgi:uracil-DNA glycosylase
MLRRTKPVAQRFYLPDNPQKNLSETVRNIKHFLPEYTALPHPLPRNHIWLKPGKFQHTFARAMMRNSGF